ncbi:hypothetical protein ACVWXS_001146 [Lysinibacillus sp. TE18511]
MSYEEVQRMTQHEIREANAAIDIHVEKINQAREASK